MASKIRTRNVQSILFPSLHLSLSLSVLCLIAYEIMLIKSRLIRFDSFIDKDLSVMFYLSKGLKIHNRVETPLPLNPSLF